MPIISGGGGGGIPSGAGSPNGTAGTLGALYVDKTNGGIYINVDGTNTWELLGGISDSNNLSDFGYPLGVQDGGAVGRLLMLALSGKRVYVSDAGAANGTGNGLFWNDLDAADGSQRLAVVLGATGNHITVLGDAAGTFGPPAGGVKFPTADPHVAGAWWDNAGTLTKSAG